MAQGSEKNVIEIEGVKYKKLSIQNIKINDKDKEFLTAEDTQKNNSVKMKITIE